MVAQPVAWYDKPGSPALPEAPSSVPHRAMAMNGETGAAAPAATRTGKGSGSSAPGAARRVEPYPTAAAGEAEAVNGPSPGSFAEAFGSVGSPAPDGERRTSPNAKRRQMTRAVTPVTMALTPPATPPRAMEPPSAGCNTEYLRLWMLQVVKEQQLAMTSLEVSVSGLRD